MQVPSIHLTRGGKIALEVGLVIIAVLIAIWLLSF